LGGPWWPSTDEGISGAKGRRQRPGLDALLKGVARREFDAVASWSVCRLGRSLSDLIGLLGELRSRDIDLYLHQQALDTSTPSGRMLLGMLEHMRRDVRSPMSYGPSEIEQTPPCPHCAARTVFRALAPSGQHEQRVYLRRCECGRESLVGVVGAAQFGVGYRGMMAHCQCSRRHREGCSTLVIAENPFYRFAIPIGRWSAAERMIASSTATP
jgi:Resolvase, N terminal domain